MNRDCTNVLKSIETYIPSDYPDSAKDLAKRLLRKNPQVRPTAAEALGHPWFDQIKTGIQAALTLNRQ